MYTRVRCRSRVIIHIFQPRARNKLVAASGSQLFILHNGEEKREKKSALSYTCSRTRFFLLTIAAFSVNRPNPLVFFFFTGIWDRWAWRKARRPSDYECTAVTLGVGLSWSPGWRLFSTIYRLSLNTHTSGPALARNSAGSTVSRVHPAPTRSLVISARTTLQTRKLAPSVRPPVRSPLPFNFLHVKLLRITRRQIYISRATTGAVIFREADEKGYRDTRARVKPATRWELLSANRFAK